MASVLSKKLPTITNIFTSDSVLCKLFYRNKGVKDNDLNLSLVSEEFIYKELSKLNPCKGVGLNGIPAMSLKEVAEILKDPISHIVNLSISTNTVPCEVKHARVKTIV